MKEDKTQEILNYIWDILTDEQKKEFLILNKIRSEEK